MGTVTKTIKSSGGDYTSLAAWESGMQDDLVSTTTISIAECYAMDDPGGTVQIEGWTTSSDYYIKIYTPASERHDGKWNTSKYRLSVSGSQPINIGDGANFIRIDGLQLYCALSSEYGFACGGSLSGARDVQISNCIAKVSGEYAGKCITLSSNGSGTAKIWNNICYSETTGYVLCIETRHFEWDSLTYVYNNTCYGGSVGVYHSGGNVPLIKNNLCNGNTTDYSGTFHASSVTNLSEDTTSPNSALQSKAVTFVNEGAYDFHLGSTDTNAINAGTDLSSDTYIAFNTDIDGTTRSGTWDIGADEYVSAGVSIPVFMHHYTFNMGRQ